MTDGVSTKREAGKKQREIQGEGTQLDAMIHDKGHNMKAAKTTYDKTRNGDLCTVGRGVILETLGINNAVGRHCS